MSIIKFVDRYVKKECAVCKFFWNYPVYDPNRIDNVPKLYHIVAHFCPHCNYVSEDISTKESFCEKHMESKEYKKIWLTKNKKYELTSHKTVVNYLALAYLKNHNHEYDKECKAYLMAGENEYEMMHSYSLSAMYTPADEPMIKNSSKLVTQYYNKALVAIIKYFEDKQTISNNEELLLCLCLIKNQRKGEAVKRMIEILKSKPDHDTMLTIKALNEME